MSNAASASKSSKKAKISEESNATDTAKQKLMRSVAPSVPTTTKEVELNGAQKGYEMPKSFRECVVDDWFTRRHENSFSSFLKILNETEASVVHEMLLGKSGLSGNISGSSGQFSDVTESSSGNIGQADGTLESSK